MQFFFLQDKYVYVCEAPSWRLKPSICTLHPSRILYMWSDHHSKGARWYAVAIVVKVIGRTKIHFHLAI